MPSDKLKKLRFNEGKYNAGSTRRRKEKSCTKGYTSFAMWCPRAFSFLVFRRVDASSDASRFFCKHISRFVSAHGRNALGFFFLALYPPSCEIKVSRVASNFASSKSRVSSARDNISQAVALIRGGQIRISPVESLLPSLFGRRNISPVSR